MKIWFLIKFNDVMRSIQPTSSSGRRLLVVVLYLSQSKLS